MVVTSALDDVFTEIEILKELQHPNVLGLYQIINHEDSGKIYLSEL